MLLGPVTEIGILKPIHEIFSFTSRFSTWLDCAGDTILARGTRKWGTFRKKTFSL